MFLERIQLKNLLSFGPEPEEIALQPLNVLIGPNGCGKSNFIEAIGLLRAAPADFTAPMRNGRGVADWIWQGDLKADSARIEAVVRPASQRSLRYGVEFAERRQGFTVINEMLTPANGDPRSFFEVRGASPMASIRIDQPGSEPRNAGLTDAAYKDYPIENRKSVLAQVKDATQYPELTCLAKDLEQIHLYRDWIFGRDNVARSLQKTDLPNAYLAEDQENLGMVLSRLSRDYKVRERIVEGLRCLSKDVSDFHLNIDFGTMQIFVQERKGKVVVPATRLSDGTIRYLTLLAILCDPNPPPLVCIEQPELSLHPDILPSLAELLLQASERCQIVVTTHSDILVDALTERPECIVVCEKEDGQTTLQRLSRSDLEHWLDKYRLGELWSSGEIGGNRW